MGGGDANQDNDEGDEGKKGHNNKDNEGDDNNNFATVPPLSPSLHRHCITTCNCEGDWEEITKTEPQWLTFCFFGPNQHTSHLAKVHSPSTSNLMYPIQFAYHLPKMKLPQLGFCFLALQPPLSCLTESHPLPLQTRCTPHKWGPLYSKAGPPTWRLSKPSPPPACFFF